MNRATAINGACIMFGLLCGAILCLQSPPGSIPPDRALDAPSLSPIRLVVNDARVEVDGWVRSDGRKTWLWRDQDCRPSRPTNLRCEGECSRAWVDGEINGRSCRLLGWWTPAGFRWRWDEQRSGYEPVGRGDGPPPATGEKAPAATPVPLQRGDLPTEDPDPRPSRDEPTPIASGLVLPSGFEPKQDPKTGALLMGVDPAGLAKDGERVRASDPQTKAEVEDVRKFYDRAPDASAQAVARNLPKVVSPNSWAAVFGYDLPTAIARVGGVGLLGGAAFMAHRRMTGAA